MKWTNHSQPVFSQSYDFTKNDLANIPKPQSQKDNDPRNQKNLIYDLRSELSNLKNQFSRLISRPGEQQARIKQDSKEINSQIPQNINSGHIRQSLNEHDRSNAQMQPVGKVQKNIFEKDPMPMTKPVKPHSRSSSFHGNQMTETKKMTQGINLYTSGSKLIQFQSASHIPVIQNSNDKKIIISNRYSRETQDQVIKKKQSFKNQITFNYEKNQTSPQTISQLTKNCENLKECLEERNKLLEEQKRQIAILNKQKQQIKDQKDSQMKQINIKMSIQFEKYKQTFLKKYEQQKKELENSIISSQRQKSQSEIQEIKLIYCSEKQIMKKQFQELKNQNEKLHLLQSQAKQENSKLGKQIESFQQKLYHKNQFIKDLLINQQKKDLEVSQATTNTQKQTSEQEQLLIKQQQQKISLYLNNIDKLNHKLKQNKSQLQISQINLQEAEFIMKEKQSIIRNLIQELKSVEKEAENHIKARNTLQNMLEDSNSQCLNSGLALLSLKFCKEI